MVQIVEQTHEQKVRMYKKVKKKKLIEMLIECNKVIASLSPTISIIPDRVTATSDYTQTFNCIN